MMNLNRLAEASSDELERAVLRSAKRDRPPAGDRERFLASLGLGASVAAAAGPAAGVATGTAAGAALKTSGFVIIAKWVGVGVLAGLVSGGVATQLSERPHQPAQKTSPTAGVAPASRAAPPAIPIETPRVPQPELLPSEPPSRRMAQSAGQASSNFPVDEEVAVLDRARNALRTGKTASALGELEEHARRFPDGVLGLEAEVLRIEALAHEDPKAATALSRAFLQRNPQIPHAKRVRLLVERLESEQR